MNGIQVGKASEDPLSLRTTECFPPYVPTAALSTGRAVVPTKGNQEPEETHECTWNTAKLDSALFTKCW
jgi:hypothetical protein